MAVKKLLLVLYLLSVFSFLLFINLYYLDGIPHVPDDQAYVFMSKIFASGHIIMPIPTSPEHVDFFPGILTVTNNTWLFQYSFGHPLLLALGTLFGFPNIIPPLVGSLFILFLFLIARKLYDQKTAVFVLFLPLLSPFFLTNASSFMSHATAAFYLTVSFYFLILSLRKRAQSALLAFLSGIFLGLLFNTRPLTAVPFIIIFTAVLVYKSIAHKKRIAAFLLGLLIMLTLWLIYNLLTTGNFFLSQYFDVNKSLFATGPSSSLGTFLAQRWQNFSILLSNFGPYMYNWPWLITLVLLLIPLLLGKNKLWTMVFYLSLVSLPIAYFFYNGTFLMYGPRFWYEIVPFVFLLTARAFSLLYEKTPKIALSVFILLSLIAFGRLFSFLPSQSPDYFSPLQLSQLRNFNFTDPKIIKKVKSMQVHNSLFLVNDCQGNWWCYGSVFTQNSPKLDTDIVYLKDLGKIQNQKVISQFSNREIYWIDYDTLDVRKLK